MNKTNRVVYNLKQWLLKKIDPVSRFVATQTLATFGGESLATGGYETYAKSYTQEAWVYKCVSLIAETCAMINGDVYMRKSGNEQELIPDHPLDILLEHPHPKFSRFEVWNHTYCSLELAGNAYWYIEKDSFGTPVQIMPLYSHRVKVVPSKSDYIAGYIYHIRGEDLALEADEVIQFKFWHPLDDFYGLSPIEAAALAITTDVYAQIWGRDFFKNSAIPEGIISTEQMLNSSEADETRKRWEQSFKGVEKAHKIAVLGKGMKYEKIGISPKDMEFLQLREFNRDEILSIFGVPYSLLSVQNKYKATAIEEEENFKRHTIKPKLALVEEKITAELLPMFGETQKKLFYAYDSLSSKDEVEERMRDEIDLKYGVLTPDEVRSKRYGLPPRLDGRGSTIFPEIGLYSVIPGSSIEPEEKIIKFLRIVKNFNREEWEKKLGKFWTEIFLRQKREVLEKIKEGAKKDLYDWDSEWDNWLVIIYPVMVGDMETIFQEGINATSAFGFETTFSSSNDKAKEWIKEHVLKDMVYQVQDTTKAQIKEAIIKGVTEGEGIPQISDRIEGIFTSKIAYHAELIARTEVASAYNWGSYLTYQESGIVKKKRWLTARDNRVCTAVCFPNEEVKEIPLIALFPSGHECPPAHPRCRCTLIPVIE